MRPRERYSPAQCRAARGLLAWPREDLAAQAGLDVDAVELFETEAGDGLAEIELAAIGAAFARSGVIATPQKRAGAGVRFAKPKAPPADIELSGPWSAPQTPFVDPSSCDDAEPDEE
jgi:hypothetical protein